MKPKITGRQADRLLLLATRLREIPKKRFFISAWVGLDWLKKKDPELSCGTTACAAGWATTIPELRAEGFFLNPIGVPNYLSEKDPRTALMNFFGTTELFFRQDYTWKDLGDEDDVTPEIAANKIERFVLEEATITKE